MIKSREYLDLVKEYADYCGRDPVEICHPEVDTLASATYLLRLHELYHWIKNRREDPLVKQLEYFMTTYPQHEVPQYREDLFALWRGWLCYIEWDVTTRFGPVEANLVKQIVSMFL